MDDAVHELRVATCVWLVVAEACASSTWRNTGMRASNAQRMPKFQPTRPAQAASSGNVLCVSIAAFVSTADMCTVQPVVKTYGWEGQSSRTVAGL